MPKFEVVKRILNDYIVEVEAVDATDAIREALSNAHEPGELTSNWNDGECLQPQAWIVLEDGIEVKPDRGMLKDLAELYCPKCGSKVQARGEVFIEAGEYDEAEQRYEDEGDYTVYRCYCGFQFAEINGVTLTEESVVAEGK